MKLKTLMTVIMVILGMVLTFGFAMAHPGVTLSSIVIDNSAGGTDNTATYIISVYLDPEVGVSEHVKLSIDPNSPDWIYVFSEDEFDMDPGDTKDVTLLMQIPQGTPAGNYILKVNSNATVPSMPWLGAETAFTQCCVKINAPVVAVPTALPILTPAGLLALMGLLAVVAVCGIRRRR